MVSVEEAMAVAGEGLGGDRYARGEGSWSRGQVGRRQVTLINALFVQRRIRVRGNASQHRDVGR
jgi:hypothetical protein